MNINKLSLGSSSELEDEVDSELEENKARELKIEDILGNESSPGLRNNMR